jgi:hypothetical protein
MRESHTYSFPRPDDVPWGGAPVQQPVPMAPTPQSGTPPYRFQGASDVQFPEAARQSDYDED